MNRCDFSVALKSLEVLVSHISLPNGFHTCSLSYNIPKKMRLAQLSVKLTQIYFSLFKQYKSFTSG